MEEVERGVFALAQAGGVAFVLEGEAGDAVLAGKGQFLLGAGEDARRVEGFQGGGLDVGAELLQFLAAGKDVDGAACHLHQPLGRQGTDARAEGEGDATEAFVGHFSFFIK